MSNTIKKTDRKNKTNLVVKWLSNFFTIDDLHAANSNFIEITLRSRLKTAQKENAIAEIGCIHSGKGRPKLVFANAPVSMDVLTNARNAGVIFNEKFDSVAVIDIDVVKSNIDNEARLAVEENIVDMTEANVNA